MGSEPAGNDRWVDAHPVEDDIKQNWIRFTAYVGQVINGIGKTCEEINTDKDMKTLENLIKELDPKQTQQ